MMGMPGMAGAIGSAGAGQTAVPRQPVPASPQGGAQGQGQAGEGVPAQGQATQQGAAPQTGQQTQQMPQQGQTLPQQGAPQGGMPQAGQGTPQGTASMFGSPGQTGSPAFAGKPAGFTQGGQTPGTFFQASMPKGFSPPTGQAMWGQVTGRQGGSFTLQFADFSMTAKTNFPLSIGQSIQVMFSQSKGSQVQLQLLQTSPFTKMNEGDLASALTRMNQPADGKNMQVARGMVEFGMALSSKNFTEVTKALSQLPRPMNPTDLAACSFLKSCNLPMTPDNIMTLSNFIARNPMLGSQLFEMQFSFDKDMKKGRSNIDNDMMKAIEELTGKMDKYVLDPKKQNQQQMKKNLRHLAQESGIERLEYRGGIKDNQEEWDLLALTRRVNQMEKEFSTAKAPALAKMQELAKGLEQNLSAQQLINQGKPAGDLAFYYMQIPLRLNGEIVTSEVRIKYFDEEEGRVIDPDNTGIEFDVTTEKLGELHFKLNTVGGVVHLEVGTQLEEVNEFVKRFIPSLQENLRRMGYGIGRFKTDGTVYLDRPQLVRRESFESLERINVQA